MSHKPISVVLRDANDDGELSAIAHILSIINHFQEHQKERIIAYVKHKISDDKRVDFT